MSALLVGPRSKDHDDLGNLDRWVLERNKGERHRRRKITIRALRSSDYTLESTQENNLAMHGL